MAPHIALHEIGVTFTPHPLSFARNETRSADFLALNPEGKVPLLLVDGQRLTEVTAILFWLARRFPAARLLPRTLDGQAQAIAWMAFLAATVHPSRRQGPEVAAATYRRADARLGARTWALGQYSVVDIHLFRLFWRYAGPAGPDPVAFPNLSAHHARMLARPAVQRTIAVESAIGYELPA